MWGGTPETENEELVINDKQIDTIAARKRPTGEVSFKFTLLKY
ncbi:hypothetical protein [Bacillus toyonensis]|nr:hypothetical protein [Bacillus toyonensis]